MRFETVPTLVGCREDSMRPFRVSSEPGAGCARRVPYEVVLHVPVGLPGVTVCGELPGMRPRLFPLSWLDGLLPTGALHPLTAQRAS